VGVDVDQAGRDVEPGDVDGLQRLRGRDVGRDRPHGPVLDGHVADGIDVVPGIDDVAALEEQVVVLRRGRTGEAQDGDQDDGHAHEGLPASIAGDSTPRAGADLALMSQTSSLRSR
jgi:hypothetical protein